LIEDHLELDQKENVSLQSLYLIDKNIIHLEKKILEETDISLLMIIIYGENEQFVKQYLKNGN
jgi:hypothetical protein